MLFLSILSIFISCFVLAKAADHIIISVRRLNSVGSKTFALSAIILAVGTSFPELAVSVTSALSGNSTVSLGTALGSNIANMSLIAGLAAFVAGKVNLRGDYLKKDIWTGLFAGVLPLILMLDSNLSRVDGIILICVYGAYAASIFRDRIEQIANEHREESFVYKFFRQFNHIATRRRKEVARLFIAVSIMLFSADIIVKLAGFIAEQASVPEFVTALLFVAIGTSLPELAFSVRSLIDHEPSMFVGNLIGSTIANSLLIVGVSTTINPIEGIVLAKYTTAVAFFMLVYITFCFIAKSKSRIDRWEALLLVGIYSVFLYMELS